MVDNKEIPQIRNAYEAIMYVGQQLMAFELDKKFTLSNPTRSYIYRAAYHCLARSPKAEQFGVSAYKGLLLVGNVGVGKSMMMDVMQRVFMDTSSRFKKVSGIDIRDLLLDDYSPMEIKYMYGKSLKMDLYIDDIGLGQIDVNKWGNVFNIISELIVERNELFLQEGYRTHFSTNVPTKMSEEDIRAEEERTGQQVKTLETMYGPRALDRLRQQTSVITWEGESLRATKAGGTII